MVQHADTFIRFPINDPEWVKSTTAAFEKVAGLPNIIGVVDGTHIAMKKPNKNGNTYRGRKTFSSLNVQVMTHKLRSIF